MNELMHRSKKATLFDHLGGSRKLSDQQQILRSNGSVDPGIAAVTVAGS